jgi:hypothetical protein
MEINMTRHQGDNGLPVIECTDTRLQKYRVRTDFQPSVDQETGEQSGVTFIETEFPYKPTLAEVREFVLGVIDRQTDGKIQSGLIWHCKATDDDIPVWLSRENQLNFKAAYDLAVQKQGATLPVTFKMGEAEDGTPVYHTFETMEDAEDFYTTAVAYVQQCLVEGWRKKDAFDFTTYEEELS